jgi:hypothetical protein
MWRSCTVGIIQDHLRNEVKAQELSLKKLATDLSKKLGRYSLDSTAVLAKGLGEILSDAVGMDSEMGKQRAFYTIHMARVQPALAFNSTTMTPAPEILRTARDQRDTVGIVVRPALLREGTSSGQDYEQPPTVLIESEVLLYPNEEPERTGRADNRQGQRREHPQSREQGGHRKASMDVRRAHAGDGDGMVRRPVRANSPSAGSSYAGTGERKKGPWFSQNYQ